MRPLFFEVHGRTMGPLFFEVHGRTFSIVSLSFSAFHIKRESWKENQVKSKLWKDYTRIWNKKDFRESRKLLALCKSTI